MKKKTESCQLVVNSLFRHITWVKNICRSLHFKGKWCLIFPCSCSFSSPNVFPLLTSRFGRKSTLLASYIMTIVFGFSSAFANSYILFAVLRFLTGVGLTGMSINSIVLSKLTSSQYQLKKVTMTSHVLCSQIVYPPPNGHKVCNWKFKIWEMCNVRLSKQLLLNSPKNVKKLPKGWYSGGMKRNNITQNTNISLKKTFQNKQKEIPFLKNNISVTNMSEKNNKTTFHIT